MRVILVNSNRIRPPVAPIGLDYVSESLAAAGHEVAVLDLCWEEDWEAATAAFFRGREAGLVGMSVRNTDDCSYTTRDSFLPDCAAMVRCLRRHTDAPVILGGAGFSVLPVEVLSRCGADAGIRGDGEFALPRLAALLDAGKPWDGVPNLVARRGNRWRSNPVVAPPLSSLPPMSRSFFDNRRYFLEGGQAGFETKRGCPRPCVYCADPVAKGKSVRARPPAAVVDELARLLGMGIDHFHTCDSEFNIPGEHAADVCREIIERGMGEKIRWYAYCAPVPFSRNLAGLMRRAGCAGINFGVDSGDAGMLARLRRNFGPADILSAARLCREAGIAVMLDLLLGSPGETRESLVATVGLMREASPDAVGVAVGVRVYPGTEIAKTTAGAGLREGLTGGNDLSDPVFFLEPAVAPFVFPLLEDLTRGDRRFLFFAPERPDRNYNYNANRVLEDAIRAGCRGAYWDILRRISGQGRSG